jgi:hypothetical protein
MAAALYLIGAAALALPGLRAVARSWASRHASVRYVLEPYRNDRASAETLLATFVALHALLGGRRPLALEAHLDRRAGGAPIAWFAVIAPAGLGRHVEAALRASYPNLRLRPLTAPLDSPGVVVPLHRRATLRASAPVADSGLVQIGRGDALLRAMAAAGPPASVQLVLRPAGGLVEQLLAGHRQDGEARRREPPPALFWAEPRVLSTDRRRARAIASALHVGAAGTRLVTGRARRHEPTPGVRRTPRRLYRLEELTELWQLPTPDFAALPVLRRGLPLAPAPPGITRPRAGRGLLRDEHGGVTIAVPVRRQHTAVVGAVEQGKTSFLVASAKEDLQRERCAVIVLDPKGDAAEAVLSAVPEHRTCTFLDMAAPAVGFNPLAVQAAPDAIADQIVGALRALFSEGEVRGSSDRYLRNATIAALACDREATLWDVARLLEVGPAGHAARARAAERLLELPDYAEVATFLAQELPAQLADARATTTAKLDAPANKLARVLNSPAVKRVLRNDSLRIDFDELIEQAGVLVVRGALGEIGAGNVAVLMQLLLGMLDAALSRVQDRRRPQERRAVALKVDEAPLVINETFAQTLALKRSAGLETVACWQTDAQWPPELREQLDALFANRVLFATASSADARAAAALLLSEFSDQIRGADDQTIRLATPDVRLHLPRHTAIVSWTTANGRERPFLGTTLPVTVDPARIAHHAASQRERATRPAKDAASDRVGGGSPALASQSPPAGTQSPPRVAQSPQPPSTSYLELRALDEATRVRWLATAPGRAARLDATDRALLEWLAAARCALTTQIHRRFRPGQALTGTQRQLKRLADAGLIARFQLHRPDGGGIPQCCALTARALELLGNTRRTAPALDDAALPALRADIHVTGWLLALELAAGSAIREILGPGRAAIAPPTTQADPEPGIHPRGISTPRPIRPNAAVELTDGDLLVVFQQSPDLDFLRDYDSFVSGWWRQIPRYKRQGKPPHVAVVCPTAEQAQDAATAAETILTGTLARIGEDPTAWERPGQARILFTAEQDLHAGSLRALRAGADPTTLPIPQSPLTPAQPPWH